MKKLFLLFILVALIVPLAIARSLDDTPSAADEATLSVTTNPICNGASTVLTASGTLNLGTNWYWYTSNCGATSVGVGTNITVSPTSTTTYYCRAENPATSFVGTFCANISVTVNTSLSGPSLTTNLTPSASVCTGTAVTISGTSTSPVVNTDLTFDGSDDYIDLGNMTVLNGASAFTFEAKVFSTDNSGFRTIFAKRVDDNNCIQLQYAQGQAGGANSLMFKVTGGSFNAYGYTDGNAFSLNAWHHVAAVFNGSGATNSDKLKLYIDGVSAPLTFVSNIPSVTVTNSNPMLIGSESTGASSLIAFQGKMEDVRIWSTARTASEVLATQSNCLTGSEAGLLVNYKFNETSGASATNSASGGGYSGAMNNFTLAICRNANATGCSGGSGSSSNTVTWSNSISNGVSFVPATTTNYIATATGSNGCVSTANVYVKVNPLPVIATNALPGTTICSGNSLTLSGSANGVNATWSGGVSNNVSFVPANSGSYTASLTDANGCSSSTSVSITVNPSVVISTPSAATICAGANTSFSITATNATNYQWQEDPNTGTFAPMSGQTSPTLNITAAAVAKNNYKYRCFASGLCSATSAAATLTVLPLPATPSISPSSTSVCAGTQVTLTAIPVGYTIAEYLWYKNGTLSNYQTGGSANYTVNTVGDGVDTYSLQVVSTANNCVSLSSANATITKHDPAAVITPAGPISFCANTPTTLNANTGMSTYQWKRGATIVQMGGTSYTPNVSGNHTVKVVDVFGCPKTSAITAITIKALPVANAGLDKNVCMGSSIQIGTAGVSANTYTWSPTTALSNANVAMPMASPLNTTTYTLTVNNATTGCTKTDAVVVTKLALPATPSLTTTATPVCEGGSVTITPSSFAVASLNWYKNGLYLYNKPTTYAEVVSIPGAATDNYTVKAVGLNGCLSSFSNYKYVWVKPAAIPTISSTLAAVGNVITICVPNGTSGNVLLTANSTTASPIYAWKLDNAIITGATGNTYNANVSTTNNNKAISVQATYANGCVKNSTTQTVTFTSTGCNNKSGTDKESADALINTQLSVGLYPNPTNDKLNITIEGCKENEGKITIYNALGQNIITQNITLNNGNAAIELDLSTFTSGVYSLSFQTHTLNSTQKVVKE